MREFKLPNHLKRHLVNLSATVQVLIGDIMLAVDGLNAEANRKASKELSEALENQRATEKLNTELGQFISCHQLPTEDATIAFASVSGRSTAEISEFLGFEQRYVMRRLCAIRKMVAQWKAPPEQSDTHEGGEVLELFAEAQNR